MILTAVRWYASYPLSATHVMQLLAERYIDVSARTVLNWRQPFGPQLAKAVSHYRRRVGRRWYVDDVFCFRSKQKRSLSRAVMVREIPFSRIGMPTYIVIPGEHQSTSQTLPTPLNAHFYISSLPGTSWAGS